MSQFVGDKLPFSLKGFSSKKEKSFQFIITSLESLEKTKIKWEKASTKELTTPAKRFICCCLNGGIYNKK